MKRWILCAGIVLVITGMANAQVKNNKAAVKTQTATKNTSAKQNKIRLESTSSNEAKAPAIPRSSQGWLNTPTISNSFQISDPILRTLNQRANGAPAMMDFKHFMGVGRGTYGVANGSILLRPNGSTTSGGITGSGAVGSGSSTGSGGMHGTVVNINGKNPYSTPGMWGTTGTGIGSSFRMTEASIRTVQAKKEQ